VAISLGVAEFVDSTRLFGYSQLDEAAPLQCRFFAEAIYPAGQRRTSERRQSCTPRDEDSSADRFDGGLS
jgi:hypothetical protein